MNLFGLAFLLTILPSVIQLVFGSLAITKRITFEFEYICLLNFIGQLFFIYIALMIVDFDSHNQNVRCGMPQVAMFFGGAFLTVILLIIIIIQIFIKRKINK